MMTKVVLLLLLAMALPSVEAEGCLDCTLSDPGTLKGICAYLGCVSNKCFADFDQIKQAYSSYDCNGAHGLLSSPILLVTAAATILVYIRG